MCLSLCLYVSIRESMCNFMCPYVSKSDLCVSLYVHMCPYVSKSVYVFLCLSVSKCV